MYLLLMFSETKVYKSHDEIIWDPDDYQYLVLKSASEVPLIIPLVI